MSDTLDHAPTAIEARQKRQAFYRSIDEKAALLRAPLPVIAPPRSWEEAAGGPPLPPMPVLTAEEFYSHCWFLIEGVSAKPRITMREVKDAVQAHYNLPDHAMIVGRRFAEWLRPRQLAMYLCKELTPNSMPKIGQAFGGADHTTILHAGRRVEKLMRKDAAYAAVVASLREKIAGSL